MKIELHNIDGYHTYAYLEPAADPPGYHSLQFSSQWETAKDPVAEQTKFTVLLSPQALDNLRTLLK